MSQQTDNTFIRKVSTVVINNPTLTQTKQLLSALSNDLIVNPGDGFLYGYYNNTFGRITVLDFLSQVNQKWESIPFDMEIFISCCSEITGFTTLHVTGGSTNNRQ